MNYALIVIAPLCLTVIALACLALLYRWMIESGTRDDARQTDIERALRDAADWSVRALYAEETARGLRAELAAMRAARTAPREQAPTASPVVPLREVTLQPAARKRRSTTTETTAVIPAVKP